MTPPLEFDKELERMLDASPELAHADLFVKFDRIKVQREQVEPIPNLAIVAGGGVNHEGAPRAGPGPWNVANVDVSINVPIFDRNQGTILQAKTALKNAQYEITRMQLDLRRRLADAFGMYLTSLQYVQVLQSIILPQAETRYRTQLKSYQENRANWREVLEAQDELFAQRQNHVVRLVQLHVPRVLAELRRISWNEIVEGSGVPLEQIRAAGKIVVGSKRMICCWSMGLPQHRNGVDTIEEAVNLLLLGGHIGKPGAGVCCMRGHSNVQGDRTVGIWERPSEEFLEALEREFNFKPPRKHGYDAVDTIKAMHEREVKVFFGLGGNFLSAAPDTAYTAEAMRRCRLTAQVSTTLHRGHLVTGEQSLILPCLGRTDRDMRPTGDQFVTVEDQMGVVSPSARCAQTSLPTSAQ